MAAVKPKDESCENCRFWLGGGKASNECHGGPPVAGTSVVGSPRHFPKTWDSDWCGQWKKADQVGDFRKKVKK